MSISRAILRGSELLTPSVLGDFGRPHAWSVTGIETDSRDARRPFWIDGVQSKMSWLSLPHPRFAPAVLAVDRALAWYIREVPLANQPPVSLAQAEYLGEVLAGTRPRANEHFEILVNFARTMYRIGQLDPGTPQVNLGDTLTALSLVPQSGEARWTFDARIDADAFAKLQFRETSVGIGKTRRENRDGWWSHAQKNRAFIEDVVGKTKGRGLAVILGAGHAFDLPLVELARSFEKLVLVDIDAEALNATVAGVLKDPGLRARTELRFLDLTGINGQLVQRVDEAVASAANAAEALDRLEALCWTYRLAEPPRLLPPSEHADLLVSSCVLSQVAWPQRVYAKRVYERRFSAVPDPLKLRWARHFTDLELRLQQDHLTSLAGVAEQVVLTCDVVSNGTVLDNAGIERKSGQTIFALGVPSLLERVPKTFQIEGHASWEWSRYKATRTGKGSRMDVEGARLTVTQTPHGLEVP